MIESLDENDKLMAIQIEAMLETPAWKYLQAYIAAQWEQIIDDASKSKSEPHWRSQQGKLRGFKLCWQIPYKIVERLKNVEAAVGYDSLQADKEIQENYGT